VPQKIGKKSTEPLTNHGLSLRAEDTKKFSFDFSYYSHDASDSNFATQHTVYSDLGIGVLENAWKGYNVCLFAYGQTGSGKSYSMVGYGPEKGIIPLSMQEMFKRIDENPNENVSFRVQCSMMEIYNEQVRDLFRPSNNQKGGLKVRESPKTGPYVEGLAKLPVTSYVGIEELMEEGSRARTVAATQMNATSSRAHTLFQIEFTQTTIDRETMKAMDKTSRINLVDLAGSERSDSTGATGDRLKEGCAINKSLSALGNCISALAMASGGKKGVFIPYRDSCLTWLLKDSLGGNAKTIMIAALSPADINYEETLSTLRYADRAKQIKTKAVVNEDPNQKVIRELRDEVERLRKMLKGGGIIEGGGEEGEKEKELAEELERTKKMMAEMEMSWEEKLKMADEVKKERQGALQVAGAMTSATTASDDCRFVNLNEDPLLSRSIQFVLHAGANTVGKRKPAAAGGAAAEIPLSGLQVHDSHAVVSLDEASRTVTLTPSESSFKVFHNGKACSGDPVTLTSGDRIIFGVSNYFLYLDPKNPGPIESEEGGVELDWELASRELMEASGASMGLIQSPEARLAVDQELAEKRKIMEEELAKAKAEAMAELEEEKKKLQGSGSNLAARAQELEEKNARLQNELEEKQRRKQKLLEDETLNMQIIEDNLVRMIPLVEEANEISAELSKPYVMQIKVMSSMDPVSKVKKTEIFLLVTNTETSAICLWPESKFQNRIYIMREKYLEFTENGSISMTQEEDPWYDPPEKQLIGTCHLYLESLSYAVSIELSTQIVGAAGENRGELEVVIAPIGPNGEGEDDIDDEEWLKPGSAASFDVSITRARGLPPALCTDVFCEYKFMLEDKVIETEHSSKKTINPDIGHKRRFDVTTVTQSLIDHIQSNVLTVEVYGTAS
jgi:Skp family chaperone for outer membrane proteins